MADKMESFNCQIELTSGGMPDDSASMIGESSGQYNLTLDIIRERYPKLFQQYLFRSLLMHLAQLRRIYLYFKRMTCKQVLQELGDIEEANSGFNRGILNKWKPVFEYLPVLSRNICNCGEYLSPILGKCIDENCNLWKISLIDNDPIVIPERYMTKDPTEYFMSPEHLEAHLFILVHRMKKYRGTIAKETNNEPFNPLAIVPVNIPGITVSQPDQPDENYPLPYWPTNVFFNILTRANLWLD